MRTWEHGAQSTGRTFVRVWAVERGVRTVHVYDTLDLYSGMECRIT